MGVLDERVCAFEILRDTVQLPAASLSYSSPVVRDFSPLARTYQYLGVLSFPGKERTARGNPKRGCECLLSLLKRFDVFFPVYVLEERQ